MADIDKLKPPPSREEKMAESQMPKAEKKEKKKKTPREKVYEIVGETFNPLAAFIARPKGANFETQYDGEEIILLLRRHLTTNLGWLLFGVFLSLAPLILITFPFLEFIPPRFLFVFFIMWYMFVFAYLFENFLIWYFNVYIITDERVVDIDFYNLAYKEVSDAEIENIEDVTLIMGGAIQTMFNFGKIKIQTAGQVPEFDFEQVPQPGKVVEVLKQLQLEEKQEAIEGRVM